MFTLPSGFRPEYQVWLGADTNSGRAKVVIDTSGNVTLGDGPFEPGNLWLTLDGLSWPYIEATSFLNWGQTDIFFGSSALDVPYTELP